MMSAQAQEMLDQLERAQNRMTLWLTVGFATGFVIGFLIAWMIVRVP